MRVWRRGSVNGSVNRNYVSDLDRFLCEFDKKPEAHSATRRGEEARYAQISRARDHRDGDRDDRDADKARA